jgi:hypothetical protein
MTAINTLESGILPESIAPTREVLEQLATLQAPRRLCITCYVRLSLQDRIRTRFRIAIHDAVHRTAAAVGQEALPHADREMILRDLARIEDYLADAGRLPHAPGLVLFACEALSLLRVMPLPQVLQHRLLVDYRPRVAEAISAVSESGRIIVTAVDRTHARFFEVTAQDVTELPGVTLPATRGGKFHSDRQDSPGWGEKDFHGRIREERHRRAAMVAHSLSELVAAGPCQGIILAGPTRATADQFRFLHPTLQARVIAMPRVNPTAATSAEIGRVTLAAREEWESKSERAVVGQLEEAIGTAWAVNGARTTLRALARGQVRELLVRSGQSGSGFQCAGSGRLVLAKADCRGEGDPTPVPDLVNEIIEEALKQRVEVVMIRDPEAAERVDGIAGFLRFR